MFFSLLTYIGNAFGILGIIVNSLIYQQKTGKKLLIYKLISDIVWTVQFILLGGYTGAAISAIGIFRELVFLNKNKKWAKSKLWLVLFLVLSVVSAIFTWKNVFSILPAVASILSVISFWRSRPGLSRALAFPISGCMLTYNLTCRSYSGVANEILTILSALVGIIRYAKEKKKVQP